jgi:hypothetical protein
MLDKKVDRIRELCKEVAGPGGAYVLCLSIATPQTSMDSQVWIEGSAPLTRGLIELGRDLVIQRGMDSISPVRRNP